MYTFDKFLTSMANVISSRAFRVAFIVLTVALFVLSAGAPNASIGIGK